jgi:hypothetical protein
MDAHQPSKCILAMTVVPYFSRGLPSAGFPSLLAESRPNPFRLATAVRISTDICVLALADLSIVSLAHSFWIHNAFSSALFFFGLSHGF